MPRSATPFDARPLTEPVDRAAVQAFTRHLRANGMLGSTSAATVIGIVVGVFVGGVVLTMFGTFGAVVLSAIGSSGAPAWLLLLIGFVLFLVFAGILTLIGFVVVRAVRGSGVRRYRLDRFARANGMTYLPGISNPSLPGMIFDIGSSRQSLDLVRGTSPRFVEFANYRFTTGSGKNSTTHEWGYVAVKLDVPLPHIVLDALGNNSFFGSNLPVSFGKDQRLSLEGDFDRYFTLSCPKGYERDALYLFTPDIMARFIDNAAALDVEIVDDWLFLYAKTDFSTLNPAVWAWLFSVVGALLDKLAQWERWRDERLESERRAAAALPAGEQGVPFVAPVEALRPPPGVAAPGRRLRRGIPWWAIVVGAVVVAAWVLPQFLGLLFAAFGP
ncbi:hypothetical protein [Microbacterium sp. SLBN-146]|uniref:hypothetical protein n=1 Tax=Microbacterium sp. SLBN-146 TaxID=2768457 RepID=UPI0011549907|nr:hypothetical protein [Microbacterium sp. SLBN-146]